MRDKGINHFNARFGEKIKGEREIKEEKKTQEVGKGEKNPAASNNFPAKWQGKKDTQKIETGKRFTCFTLSM